MTNNDLSATLQQQVCDAYENNSPLCIAGSHSKDFYGRAAKGDTLNLQQHSGIIEYHPTELVITAHAGTSLADINTALTEQQQILPFDPPMFNNKGTLGGAIACGLSGPSRPWTGAIRDAVLGVSCLNGKGEQLKFGGQVMKNVAGYDVARLMCGSLGTLGVLLDISIKLLPQPAKTLTLVMEQDATTMLKTMATLNSQPLAITGACHYQGKLMVRLSGTEQAIKASQKIIAGEEHEVNDFWQQLRDHRLDFFNDTRPLWRLSLPPATLALQLDGDSLIDWGGAQRWLSSEESPEIIRELCIAHGGHATLFNNGDRNSDIFQPLEIGLSGIHQQLKQAFDPRGILNPHRMYRDW